MVCWRWLHAPAPDLPQHVGGLLNLPPPHRVARHRIAEGGLLGGIRRLLTAAGAQAEQQTPAADVLERSSHHGYDTRMAISHVEHERADRHPLSDRRQRREQRPAFEDVARSMHPAHQVVPGP